jgi:hypothetical protein
MGLPPPAEGAEDKGGISEFDCMSEDEETAARTTIDEIQHRENQTKFAFVQQRECVKFDNQSPKMRGGGHAGGLGARLSSCRLNIAAARISRAERQSATYCNSIFGPGGGRLGVF